MSDDAEARKERLQKLRNRQQPAPEALDGFGLEPVDEPAAAPKRRGGGRGGLGAGAGGERGGRMVEMVLRLLTAGPKVPGSRVSEQGLARLAQLLGGRDGPLAKRVLDFLSQPGEPRVAGLSVAQADKLLALLSRRAGGGQGGGGANGAGGGDMAAVLDRLGDTVQQLARKVDGMEGGKARSSSPAGEAGTPWISTLADDF